MILTNLKITSCLLSGIVILAFSGCDGTTGIASDDSLSGGEAQIMHNGVGYDMVTSPYTGRVWLDRNLGASQVCTAIDDAACYGDYYQWGRNSDGHQDSNSTVTSTLADSVNIVRGDYIIVPSDPSDWVDNDIDNNGSIRAANWSSIDGSSVCPAGYRVPTLAELEAETTLASTPVTNSEDAFNDFLKLPSAGARTYADGTIIFEGSGGYIWSVSSASIYSDYSDALFFNDGEALTAPGIRRAYGFNIRCIKN